MLEQFPFDILGFHADNGSEYVNHRVAKMLDPSSGALVAPALPALPSPPPNHY